MCSLCGGYGLRADEYISTRCRNCDGLGYVYLLTSWRPADTARE